MSLQCKAGWRAANNSMGDCEINEVRLVSLVGDHGVIGIPRVDAFRRTSNGNKAECEMAWASPICGQWRLRGMPDDELGRAFGQTDAACRRNERALSPLPKSTPLQH